MAVRVVDAPFDVAPTSGADPGTTAPQPPTVVFKLTPSTWLWFATVGVFTAVLTCVTLICLNERRSPEMRCTDVHPANNFVLAYPLARAN